MIQTSAPVVNNLTLTNGNGHNTSTHTKALLELESNTNLNKALLALLKSSFFENKPVNWKPVKCELVVNTKLTEEFQQIKSEFEANPEAEAEEKYAFIVDTDAQINEIALNGYSCPENTYNVIGQSKSGVYLCKYPDVNMKFAEAKKWPDNLTLKMIVFKVCYGKQTLALVRKDAKLPPIVATPNFNSHMSVIPPKEKDDIEVQFDHSQVYLYELNAQKQATKRPRHCLPYAVITWLKFNDGTEWPQYFPESSDSHLSILGTDSLKLALQSTEDVYLQTKLKALLKTSADLVHDNCKLANGNSNGHVVVNGSTPNVVTNGIATNGLPTNGDSVRTNGDISHTNGDSAETNGALSPTDTNNKPNESTESSIKPELVIPETNGLITNGLSDAIEEKTSPEAEIKTEISDQVVADESKKEPTENQIGDNTEGTNTEEMQESENKEKLDAENKSESESKPESNQDVPVQPTPNTTTQAESGTEAKPSDGEVSTVLPGTTLSARTTPTSSATQVVTSGPTVSPSVPSTGYQGHKTSLSHFNKPYSSPYRVNQHMPSYLHAAQSQAAAQLGQYGAIPYHQQRFMQSNAMQLQQLGGLAGHGQMGGQGQMYLVRGPNGVSYLSSGVPQQAQYGVQQQHQQQQQLLIAQAQAQAQQQAQYQNAAATQAALYAKQLALQQAQQAQQGQNQALTYAAAPTQYKQGQPPQQQSQIIYQSAPQPAQPQGGAAKSNPQASASTTAPAPPPPQAPSPKQPNQQHAAAQYAAAQYVSQQQAQAQAQAQAQVQAQAQQAQATSSGSGQQLSQLQQMQAAAIAGNTSGASGATQQYMQGANAQQNLILSQGQSTGTATQQQQQLQLQQQLSLIQQQQLSQQLAQQQQQQQQQQQSQNSQLLAYQQQLAAQGLSMNGMPGGQGYSQAQLGQLQGAPGVQVPAGYQLVQAAYQNQVGLPLDQLAALGGSVPRPRIVNLRHHPYQRN